MTVVLGCQSRSVRDVARWYDVCAGFDPRDPYSLPKVDGWEMLRRVQERHGVGSIPVRMFSGKVEQAGDVTERGASGFIGKPFDRDLVLSATAETGRLVVCDIGWRSGGWSAELVATVAEATEPPLFTSSNVGLPAGGLVTVNASVLVPVPPGPVTEIVPVVAPLGTDVEIVMSLSTVKTHLAAAQNKIKARNRVETAAWAWRSGLMEDA